MAMINSKKRKKNNNIVLGGKQEKHKCKKSKLDVDASSTFIKSHHMGWQLQSEKNAEWIHQI